MPEGRTECEVRVSLQEEVRTEKLRVGDREPDKAEAMNSALRGSRSTTRSSTSGAKGPGQMSESEFAGMTERPGQMSESEFARMTDVVRERHDVKGVSQEESKWWSDDFKRVEESSKPKGHG